MESRIGEIAAFATAVCWTATALSFQAAGKKIGSLSVNIIRLMFGLTLLSIFTFFYRGMFLPFDASTSAWLWLSASGVVGFFLGDLFLFKSYTMIGARIATLITAVVPPMTALLGWVFLKENLHGIQIIGMGITLCGIALVILKRNKENRQVNFSHPIKGVVFALLGAVGQSSGYILSKLGLTGYDPFAATQIRIIAAIPCFILLITYLKAWPKVISSFNNKSAIVTTATGSLFGPFLGVSLSLLAIQYVATGVASTIIALVPVMIIVPSVILFKEKITVKEVAGALLAIAGIWILCL